MNSLSNFGKIFGWLGCLAQPPSRFSARLHAAPQPPPGAPSWCLEARLRLHPRVGPRPSAEHRLPGRTPPRVRPPGPDSSRVSSLGIAQPPHRPPGPAPPRPHLFGSGCALDPLSGLWFSSLIRFLDYGCVPLRLLDRAPPPGRPAPWALAPPPPPGFRSRPTSRAYRSRPFQPRFPSRPASRAEAPPLQLGSSPAPSWSPPLLPALLGIWRLVHCPGPGSAGGGATAEHHAISAGPEPLQRALPAGAEPQGGGAQWAEAG